MRRPDVEDLHEAPDMPDTKSGRVAEVVDPLGATEPDQIGRIDVEVFAELGEIVAPAQFGASAELAAVHEHDGIDVARVTILRHRLQIVGANAVNVNEPALDSHGYGVKFSRSGA